MKLTVIFGSTRAGRKGEVVANWVQKGVEPDSRFELDFADLREVNLPFFDEPMDPFGMKEAGVDYTHPEGRAWADRVKAADGFIMITPEYNHSAPAVLKNCIDWVGPEWADKPVGFISYGGIAGGARAVEHLRQMVIEVSLVQVANAIHFPFFQKAFDEQGQPVRSNYNDNLNSMLDEIMRLHTAFRKG
jgi:NAD(P)H-dependent FMN reductase